MFGVKMALGFRLSALDGSTLLALGSRKSMLICFEQ
jgi:hypothetical protein